MDRMTAQRIAIAVEDIGKSLDIPPSQVLTPAADRRLRELIAQELRDRGVEAQV